MSDRRAPLSVPARTADDACVHCPQEVEREAPNNAIVIVIFGAIAMVLQVRVPAAAARARRAA